MAHYTINDIMSLGMQSLLNQGVFDEIIAEMKAWFDNYEIGFYRSGEVMTTLIRKIEAKAYDMSWLEDVRTEEEGADAQIVYNAARSFLLGILFEYIGQSNLDSDQFIKLITNHE